MRYKIFWIIVLAIFTLPVIMHAEYKYYDLYKKAYELKKQKKYEEALLLYDNVIKANPDFAGVRLNKGNLLFEMGGFEEGLKSIDEFIEMKPDDSEGWYNKGTALMKMKEYTDAIVAFDKAVELDPAATEKRYNHGLTLWALNRHDDALASFRKIMGIEVDFPGAYIQSINLLFGQKRYQEAFGICDEVIKTTGYRVGIFVQGAVPDGNGPVRPCARRQKNMIIVLD